MCNLKLLSCKCLPLIHVCRTRLYLKALPVRPLDNHNKLLNRQVCPDNICNEGGGTKRTLVSPANSLARSRQKKARKRMDWTIIENGKLPPECCFRRSDQPGLRTFLLLALPYLTIIYQGERRSTLFAKLFTGDGLPMAWRRRGVCHKQMPFLGADCF